MVLESLYQFVFEKKKWWFLLLLGFVFSICSITLSLIFFPSSPSLIAIGFVSILFLSSFGKLISSDEVSIEANLYKTKKNFFSGKLQLLISSYGDLIKLYLIIYASVFCVFAFFSIILPAEATLHFFQEQTLFADNLFFNDIFIPNSFSQILNNNLKVMSTALIGSVLFGTGAIFVFFIAWNASVTGAVFGFIAKNQAVDIGTAPLLFFLIMLIAVLPHMLLEMFSYFFAGVGGGIGSRSLIKHKFNLSKMANISNYLIITIILAVALLILGALIESSITPWLVNLFSSVLSR